jgi:hypothetical protein
MAKKFYGLDIRGKNWLQRLAAAPVWTAEDEGRIFYDEGDEGVKFGTSVEWSNAGSYNDVPLNTILLIESDVQLAGYTLLTNKDDMSVYITKGSGAAGEAGGTDKAGGTWTQAVHTHTTLSHTHALGTHTHTVGNHVHPTSAAGISISQMPSHTHGCSPDNTSGGGGDREAGSGFGALTTPTGGNATHTHGNTLGASGSSGGPTGGSDSGGGAPTGGGATANTWRPRGRNFTRQQRT